MAEDISNKKPFSSWMMHIDTDDVHPPVHFTLVRPRRIVDVTDLCTGSMDRSATTILRYGQVGEVLFAQLYESPAPVKTGVRQKLSSYAIGELGLDVMGVSDYQSQTEQLGCDPLEMAVTMFEYMPNPDSYGGH